MPVLLALLLAAAALSTPPFSDPLPVAETTIAAPPALAGTEDVLHLFWLTRPPSAPPATGEIWHAAVSARGTVGVAPHRVASGADTRLAWPAAARAGSAVVAAWMARETDAVRLQVAFVGADGSVRAMAAPAPPGEEGGRIAILEHGGRVHLAWSQFSSGRREIWYLRLLPDGTPEIPARPLAEGDAPALAGGETLSLLWWRPAASGNYVLAMAEVDDDGLDRTEELTGQILLVSPIPPIPITRNDGLDVLVPTIERAFRTAGRLYLVRVRGPEVTARLPLSGSRVLTDVTAASAGDQATVFWVEAAGRRQNAEIFAATFEEGAGRLAGVTRVSYTPPGSLRPAGAVVEAMPVVAWLETVDIARFRLVLATPTGARSRTFLLETPELDLRRPGTLVAFSATVAVGILPYAALLASAFGMAALVLWLLAGAVVGGFRWWQALQERPVRRLLAFFAVVLAIELPARALIPGQPGGGFLAAALVLPVVAAVAAGPRRPLTGMTGLVAGAVVLLAQMLAVLFPWGVRQLTQF